MKAMKLIAAVDQNWAIGKNNDLLVSIPADMKFFRETTTGNVVVMGRKTLESFPGQKPLKNRVNLVLTENPAYQKEGALIVHDLQELKKALAAYEGVDVYVVGGASIYKLLLPLCDTAYITKIDYAYDADAWLPNLDADPEWELASVGEEQVHYSLTYHFCEYRRVV